MLNKDFWQDKKVSIAGGCSFIASHTIPALLDAGVESITLSDDLSSGQNYEMHPKVLLLKLDLRDYDNAILATRGADIVLDFASVHGGRGFVGTNHDVAISDNLIINTNVLRAAVENKVKQISFASSGCIYDTREQMDEKLDFKITEDWTERWGYGHEDGMYGLTKSVHERVLQAYHKDGLIKASICRFFTVFGRRMKENHFILASIAKSFIKTDPFYVWGTGEIVRNFTPVQNTVEGFLLATENPNGEAYNIGLEQRITIDFALESIWDLMGWRPKEVVYQPEKPVGIRNRVSDCTKARVHLGWTPTVTFQEGLKDTIDWYVSTHEETQVRAELEGKLTSR